VRYKIFYLTALLVMSTYIMWHIHTTHVHTYIKAQRSPTMNHKQSHTHRHIQTYSHIHTHTRTRIFTNKKTKSKSKVKKYKYKSTLEVTSVH